MRTLANLNSLEKYLIIDNRELFLHLIGKDLHKTSRETSINYEALLNFSKYSYEDYLIVKQNKAFRYITLNNCLRLLDYNQFKLNLEIKVN